MKTSPIVTSIRTVWGEAGTPARIALTLLAVLLVLWTSRLVPDWRANPDLSHGWFTPILFLVLLHESRARGRRRYLPASASVWAATAVCLTGAFVLVLVGCLYAVALHWTHPLVNASIGVGGALGLLAGLLVASTDRSRLVPFNWPALAAIGLWLLSLPLPPGTYSQLTLYLQSHVTDAVLGSLHLLGIPATKSGNVIDLATTSVGVKEACSGIRSLISCIYAALFFSAALVQRPWARLLMLGLAAPLAIGMNFLRSLLLTLLANSGVEIRGAWHDVTGFAILAITAACLGALALVLARGEKIAPAAAALPSAAAPASGRHSGFVLLASGYGLIALCGAFFMLMTRPADIRAESITDLAALLPTESPGWSFVASTDLDPFADILQTEQLVQRTYLRQDPTGVTQLTLYLAYWPPGRVPVSAVAAHTPDICWPGSGWELQPSSLRRMRLPLDGAHESSPAEYRKFVGARGAPQHVWYWHIYDRRVIQAPDALSPTDLLRTAITFGIRNKGEQLFVRVSSNRPWPDIREHELVRDLFARLADFGL